MADSAANSQGIAAIEAGRHPAREDLDVALTKIPREAYPDALIEYVRKVYVCGLPPRGMRPRPPGPAKGRRTRARDDLMRWHYRMAVRDLQLAEQSREVRTRALDDTARCFGVSRRTVQRIAKTLHR